MNSQKNFKATTSAFLVSIFTLTQIFSVSSFAFAQPEVTSSQDPSQGAVLTLNQANQRTQQVRIETPINTDTNIDFLTKSKTLSLSAVNTVTTVSRPHRKAEDTKNPDGTSNSKITYNAENGKLVLYAQVGPKQYEKRITDISGVRNGDIISAQASADGKKITISTYQKTYELILEPNTTTLKEVKAIYQIAIGQGITVKFYQGRPRYELTYNGQTYASDENGSVRLTDGTRLSWIDASKELAILTNSGQVKDRFRFEFMNNVYQLAEIIRTDGEDSVATRTVFDHINKITSTLGTYPPVNGNGPASYVISSFYDLNQDLGKLISIRNSFVETSSQVFLWFVTIDGNLSSISVQDHQVFIKNQPDLTFTNISSLKSRDLESVKKLLGDDQLVKIGQSVTVNNQLATVASVTDGKIHFLFSPSGQIVDSATDAQGNVTLAIPQDDGTKKIYDVKIDDEGIVSLGFAQEGVWIPSNTAVIKNIDGNSFGNESLKFNFKIFVNGKLTVQVEDRLGNKQNIEARKDINGKLILVFNDQSDSFKTKIFQLKNDDQKNLVVTQKVATTLLHLNQALWIDALVDGSYRVNQSPSTTYISDRLGVVTFDDGTRALFRFNVDGTIRSLTLLQDADIEVRVILEKDVTDVLAVARTETYWKKSILQSRQTFNQKDGTYLEENLCEKTDCSNPSSRFFIYKQPFPFFIPGLFIEQGKIVDVPRSFDEIYVAAHQWTEIIGEETKSTTDAANGQTTGTTTPKKVQRLSVTHYAGDKVYQLYQQGPNVDVSTFDLVKIQDRTTKNLFNLLRDDRFVEEGQMITASDGTKFKLVSAGLQRLDLRRATENGGVSLGEEVTVIYGTYGNVQQISVRQTSGASIIYDISIDPKGIIRLYRHADNFQILPLRNAQGGVVANYVETDDVNGDGVIDFILNYREKIYVIYGRAQGYSLNIDPAALTSEQGYVLTTDHINSTDVNIRVITDINGDGYSDFLVNSYGDAKPSTVIFGGADGNPVIKDFSAINGTNGFRIDDPNANVRDLDRDGLSDIQLIKDNVNYVLYGRKGNYPAKVTPQDLKGFGILPFKDSQGNPVTALLRVNDLNGDGLPDFSLTREDKVYVVYGRVQGYASDIDLAALTAEQGYVVKTDYTRSFNTNIRMIPDINGDGYQDFTLSTYDEPKPSAVIFGDIDGNPVIKDFSAINGTNGFRIEDPYASIYDDFNGDGLVDITSRKENTTHILFGQGGNYPALVTSQNLKGFRILPLKDAQGKEVFSYRITDLNQDGQMDYAGSADGKIHIINGLRAQEGAVIDPNFVSSQSGYVITTNYTGGYTNVFMVDDLNGDGFREFFITSFNDNSNLSTVIFGDKDGNPLIKDFAAINGANGFRIDDQSANVFNDLNGDGIGDIMINKNGTYSIIFGHAGAYPVELRID